MEQKTPAVSQDTIFQLAQVIKNLRNSLESHNMEMSINPEWLKMFFVAKIFIKNSKNVSMSLISIDNPNILKVAIYAPVEDKNRFSSADHDWLLWYRWIHKSFPDNYYSNNFKIYTDKEILMVSAELVTTLISVFDFSPEEPISIEMSEEVDTFSAIKKGLPLIIKMYVIKAKNYVIAKVRKISGFFEGKV